MSSPELTQILFWPFHCCFIQNREIFLQQRNTSLLTYIIISKKINKRQTKRAIHLIKSRGSISIWNLKKYDYEFCFMCQKCLKGHIKPCFTSASSLFLPFLSDSPGCGSGGKGWTMSVSLTCQEQVAHQWQAQNVNSHLLVSIWTNCSVFSIGQSSHDCYYHDHEDVGGSLVDQIWTWHTFSFNPSNSLPLPFLEVSVERIKAQFWLDIAINKLP